MLTLSFLKDFYVLLSVQRLSEGKSYPRAWDKLYHDTTNYLNELAENLALAMRDYLTLAAFGEARHAISNAGRKRYPNFVNFDTIGGSLGREDAMHEATMYDPEKSLPLIVELFNEEEGWANPSSIGGPRWGTIAQAALYWYTAFKDRPVAFVDHCADIQHNNGTAFSKSEASAIMDASMHSWHDNHFSRVNNFLSYKMRSTPEDIIRGIDPHSFKGYSLAQRWSVLSDRDYERTLPEAGESIKYKPVQWGNATIEMVKKTGGRDCSDKVRFDKQVDWNLIVTPMPPPESMPVADIEAFIHDKNFCADYTDKAIELVQPFIEKMPQYKEKILEVARYKASTLKERARATYHDTLLAYYNDLPIPPWDKVIHKFNSKEYASPGELLTAADDLRLALRKEANKYLITLKLSASTSMHVSLYWMNRADALAIKKRDEKSNALVGMDLNDWSYALSRPMNYANNLRGKMLTASGNLRRPATIRRMIDVAKLQMRNSLYLRSLACKELATEVFEKEAEKIVAEEKERSIKMKEALEQYHSMSDAMQSKKLSSLNPQVAAEKFVLRYHVYDTDSTS